MSYLIKLDRYKVVIDSIINTQNEIEMKEFMMIFRNDYNPNIKPSPEQLQANVKKWQDWIGGIAAQGKFVGTNRLGFEGKTLNPNNVITDGPYTEIKEIIGGYIIVKSNTIDEALELAKNCPVLDIGGNVEVRDIMSITL
ncbi:YciI family protein [Aureispira anguillae]|uniref:YciI family protein n=2 Tax=Aureispira anguillae TaxID=2864201 RepID=A0A916DSZ4_9BACT|nr:YciI family protein [Aureispira anguillae]